MNFSNVPDLVIVGILKNTMTGLDQISGIKNSLPFLAINRKWRALALPIMHKYVFIEGNDFPNLYLESNVGLVMDGRYTRQLSINIYTENIKLIDNLEAFIIQMNSSRSVTSWPTDNINNTSAQKGMVDGAIQNHLLSFAATFPNISKLHIKLAVDKKLDKNFASQLINAYTNQLTELTCDVNVPLVITHFPKRLVKLDYSYPYRGTSSIPLINPYPLKELFLSYAPDTWSWQQCCESSMFPNLEFLSISTNPNNKLDLIDKANEIKVDLPKLKRLCISDDIIEKRHKLKFGNISQHIDRVIIEGSVSLLDEICNLKIKSIGWLKVKLSDNEDLDMEEFYKVTNRLFSSYKNISLQLIEAMEIDYKQTRWKNVKELILSEGCANEVLNVLTHLSNLKTFVLYWIYYNSGMDQSLLEPLKHSKVQNFDVHASFAIDELERAELENQKNIIRKHLPMLQKKKKLNR